MAPYHHTLIMACQKWLQSIWGLAHQFLYLCTHQCVSAWNLRLWSVSQGGALGCHGTVPLCSAVEAG